MPGPDIPAAKRAGLPVDLDRLAAEGDGWLTPEDRYALKTWGVCTQLQAGVFMVRVRIPGGTLPTVQARALARLSRRFGPDWLHLTTRQNVELHWVDDRRVRDLLDELGRVGLTTRASCGHTLRNVMSSEDAGVSLDEPFDCLPDAVAVSAALVARAAELNVVLPSRLNVAFGGSPRCRDDALVNDAGFVSILRDGEPGYELWAGGSLGRSPALAVPLAGFVARVDVLAAAEALVEVFVAHGDLDKPASGRLKFVVQRMGVDRFTTAWAGAFAAARRRPHPAPALVDVLDDGDRVAILEQRPPGGWSVGVRPQRTPGRASVTVEIPLGDTCGSELELLCDLADRLGDGHLVLGRDQDVVLRNVPIDAVATIREAISVRGLRLRGEGEAPSVRACTGSAVCALGIAPAPETARDLLGAGALARNAPLRVHVSGCPNSCAQHQLADIGLAGTKVRLGGRTRTGYHLYLGADLATGRVGEVVGRVADGDVAAAVEAIVGVWEALRRRREDLGAFVHRVGHEAVAAHVAALMVERWAAGPEPDAEPVAVAVP